MWKKRGFLTAGLCFCVSALGLTQHTEAAPNKVTICHKSQGMGKFQQLSVAGSALRAHLGHGDCVVDDGVPCTVDSCNASLGCVHAPDNSQCEDGDACSSDSCNPAAGCVHSPITCNDGNACTSDSCNPATGCVHSPITCNDGNACTVDTCDPATGCLHGPNPCGDGVVCPPEECDDGNNNAGDGCSPVCTKEFCGDGVVNGTEQCDGGGETATCNSNCTTSRCGDRIINVHAGEQCDDGNTANGDGCSSTCQNEVGGIPNDNCDAAIAVSEGTRTYSNVGATTDGPDEPATCNFSGDTNVNSDIWYCYTTTVTCTAMVSLCGSDYDTKLAVYAGCGCPTAAPLACSDDDCGGTGNVQQQQSRVTIGEVTPGQKYLVRVGGYLDKQGDGRLTIGCDVDACGTGGGCFTTNQPPGCDDAACCAQVCELDRFCCDVTWDQNCANEAEGICHESFPTCGPGTGACGIPDNTPGCDNVACCNTVCRVDLFCCLEEWDSTCVAEANSMCFLTCGPGAGDCHSAHATPGCNSQTCCEAVCTNDPFCCETAWDQTCKDAAVGPACP